ncbi:hypothetical protein [Erwinia phage Pecta]|nr:hypothetical protein [Erwinia phage Pecta]
MDLEYVHVLNRGDFVVFSSGFEIPEEDEDLVVGTLYEIHEAPDGSAFFFDDGGSMREYPLLKEAEAFGYSYTVVPAQLEND